jgi:hypothetical protein
MPCRSVAAKKLRIRKALPMLFAELFASVRERRRHSAQQSYEEGAQITRRLQELLSVPNPALGETPSTSACSETDPTIRVKPTALVP